MNLLSNCFSLKEAYLKYDTRISIYYSILMCTSAQSFCSLLSFELPQVGKPLDPLHIPHAMAPII